MKKREEQWVKRNENYIVQTWSAILQALESNKEWNEQKEDFELSHGCGQLITHLKYVCKKCPSLAVFEHLADNYGLYSALPHQVYQDIIDLFPKPNKKNGK